jgi:carboxyl-terminal processing protease
MLVNGGTRSGKEILPWLQKYRLGEVIGTRTGELSRCDGISHWRQLAVALVDVHVDGERLEGVGVAPTIEVQADTGSMDRSDPQLNRAIAVLSGV